MPHDVGQFAGKEAGIPEFPELVVQKQDQHSREEECR